MDRPDDIVARRIRASKIADFLAQLRWLVLAAAGGIVLGFLWPRPSGSVPEGVTEIHLWVPNGAGGRFRDALDTFEARFPQYQIVAGNSQLRDASSDPQRFLCGVAGGVPPDVIYFDRFAVVAWAARSMFHPLDEYVAAERREHERLLGEMAASRTEGNRDRLDRLAVTANHRAIEIQEDTLQWSHASVTLSAGLPPEEPRYSHPPKDRGDSIPQRTAAIHCRNPAPG